MSVPLFLNPTAGRGRAAKSVPAIVDGLRASGVTVELVESRNKGDLEARLLDAARGGAASAIVAGGDGSVHEAVNAIMRSGQATALGILPVGTGNDFAKACGLPLDPTEAARALGQRIAAGKAPSNVDIGTCNERYFANGAGIGIDARVAAYAAPIRLPIGDLVYAYGVLRCLLAGIATPSMRVEIDGTETWSGPTTLTNIANGRWVGGSFLIAPDASPDDGRFDIVIAAAVSRLRVLGLLGPLMRGEHVNAAEIRVFRGHDVRIRCDEALIAHLDGELQPASRAFDIRLLPGALRLL